MSRPQNTFCNRTRREFLWQAGAGFTSLGLTGLLSGDGFFNKAMAAEGQPMANPLAPKPPHFAPKAKSVIFLFMYGGPSHIDTFDYKPTMYDLDGKTVKVTDFQKSAALKQAIAVAAKLKDFAQADELVALIPLEAERKNADMQNLLAQRKFADLLKRYADEDLAQGPFTSAGEAYIARGRAYAATGDKAKAEADFRAALPLTADKRARADLLKLLGETEKK